MSLSEKSALSAVPVAVQEGQKIDAKAISARIDENIYIKAKVLAVKKRMKFNELIEAALEEYVTSNE